MTAKAHRSMTKKKEPIAQTKAWIEKVVLKYQLCPFAQIPFQKDQIKYRYIESALIEDFNNVSIYGIIGFCVCELG